jgi:subtilisin
MARYVLVNRRAGLFSPEAKIASRASVATTLGSMPNAKIVSDHQPEDPLARRVVIFDAEPADLAKMLPTLPHSSVVEPLMRRRLHPRIRPGLMRDSIPLEVKVSRVSKSQYSVKFTAGGKPLDGIQALLYISDANGQVNNVTVNADAQGKVAITLASGSRISMVEPIPFDSYWIMLVEAPLTGSTVDCLPLAKAGANGNGWWHDVMGVDTTAAKRGSGIKVGVIDTGCGPHPNLAHVNLVGAFVDGGRLAGAQATDVAQHGTHTTGIIGARPTRAGDYAGMAAGCDLYHARVFKGEGPQDGPSQADLINAIDALSRDQQCDLINMSLGGAPPSPMEEDAIRDAVERGTLCVCSAGNEASSIEYPGAYQECAAVSAIGLLGWAPPGTFSSSNRPQDPSLMGSDNLFLAAFSCFAGPGQTLACAGPGVGIISTVPDRAALTGRYMEMDGTSMASPAACGALAVILSNDANYKSLPRNGSRTNAAQNLLAQHCKSIGLSAKYEGRGLPQIS